MISNPEAINVASRAVIVVENFRVSMQVSMVWGIRSIQSPPSSGKTAAMLSLPMHECTLTEEGLPSCCRSLSEVVNANRTVDSTIRQAIGPGGAKLFAAFQYFIVYLCLTRPICAPRFHSTVGFSTAPTHLGLNVCNRPHQKRPAAMTNVYYEIHRQRVTGTTRRNAKSG